MTEEKDQLVDEGVMEKMSVAPPDPESETSEEDPGEQPLGQGNAPDAPPPGESGVADEDPLSAHPT